MIRNLHQPIEICTNPVGLQLLELNTISMIDSVSYHRFRLMDDGYGMNNAENLFIIGRNNQFQRTISLLMQS